MDENEVSAHFGIGTTPSTTVPPILGYAVESEPVMSQAESWKAFGIRAFKTFVQGATAVLLANALNIFDASALEAAVTGGFGAIVSFLNNWASAAEAPKATTGK